MAKSPEVEHLQAIVEQFLAAAQQYRDAAAREASDLRASPAPLRSVDQMVHWQLVGMLDRARIDLDDLIQLFENDVLDRLIRIADTYG